MAQQKYQQSGSARQSSRHIQYHHRATNRPPVRKYWRKIIMHPFSKHGTVSDPLMLKLLEVINNESQSEVESVLSSLSPEELDRVRNTDIKGATLLHYACSRNNPLVVDALVKHGFDINRKTKKEVELYLEVYDFVSSFRAGSSPIYIATVSGRYNTVALLAKRGANPNDSDLEGYTPLHNAAWHNNVNIITQLLSCGAKVNLQDSTGSTPLRKASYRGQTEAVKHLLNNGADPNIRTRRGRAPIHCAALYGHTEVVALLIEYGAQIDIQDNDNVTPLHAAVYNGKRAVVKELIKANADLNIETKFGNTPLHLACMEKWFVIASMLVQSGADSSKKNRFGETCHSITESINTGGQRVSIFSGGVPLPMSELEQLEAAHREKSNPSISTATIQSENSKKISRNGSLPTILEKKDKAKKKEKDSQSLVEK